MVTVDTVLSPPAAALRSRPGRRGRAAAAMLPAAAAAAGAAVVIAAVALRALSGPVLCLVVCWPLLLTVLAGRAPVAGAPGRHHRRAVGRGLAVLAGVQWLLAGRVASPRVLLVATVALAAGTLAAGALAAAAQRRAGVRPRAVVVGDLPGLRTGLDQITTLAGRDVDVVDGCTPAELATTLDRARPDLVLAVPGPRLSGRALQRLAWQLEEGPDGREVPLLLLTGLHDVSPRRTRPGALGGLGVSELARPRHRGGAGAAKVVWERAAAALALGLAAPVLLALAVLIRLDSPGPALFRQTRVGRHGRPFTMLKLRTMHADAERLRDAVDSDVDGVLFKARTDPRITRFGRLLRRYSLDELPQLLNVVRGEMSLVGPRPALPAEVAAYDEDPRRRLVVRPGLTGLWQVSGRSDLSWRETVRLDLDYVDNWSLGRDLAIVGRTLHAVLAHRGAY